jgi:hypothetical protein
MVVALLAVLVGLKLPHELLLQVTVQVTPAFFESLVTMAAMLVVALIASDDGGCEAKATLMVAPEDVMVTVAEIDLVLSVTEVAVMVTVAGDGTVEGAVYVVVWPLPVEDGEMEPQEEPPQLTVQETPALALSLVT